MWRCPFQRDPQPVGVILLLQLSVSLGAQGMSRIVEIATGANVRDDRTYSTVDDTALWNLIASVAKGVSGGYGAMRRCQGIKGLVQTISQRRSHSIHPNSRSALLGRNSLSSSETILTENRGCTKCFSILHHHCTSHAVLPFRGRLTQNLKKHDLAHFAGTGESSRS